MSCLTSKARFEVVSKVLTSFIEYARATEDADAVQYVRVVIVPVDVAIPSHATMD
jgi:hypothetical protein